MARLRFPGRPGHRYGRSLVRYLPEKDRSRQHVFFARTAAIQTNLKWFYDLFGDSDEEDDFHGFTEAEIGDLPSPLKTKKWAKKEDDPSLSPKIKNYKASWPIIGRRAGREMHYVKQNTCAEMKRGEWDTSKPYKVKGSRVVDGRIQKLKPAKKAGACALGREKRSVGRLSYRDMVKGVDVVRPKLIPPKPPKEPKKVLSKVGMKLAGKLRFPFTMPKQKGASAKNQMKFKIKMSDDGQQGKIVGGKDVAVPWGKARIGKAQQLLNRAKGKKTEVSPVKFKPWGKKKLLLAQAQNGSLENSGKVVCVPKSKQVNMSKAMELVKKAKDAQRKSQQVFGSDTPGKRSVKCSSKLAGMDMKGVDLHFLHRKITPPSKKGALSKFSGLKSKQKLKLGSSQSLPDKTPKAPRPGFVMPVVSSRSSRVIKPTKRFIEQDEFSSSLFTTPSAGNDSGDWTDIQSDLDASFMSPYGVSTPDNSENKTKTKTPKKGMSDLATAEKEKKKKKSKLKDETTKENTFQGQYLKMFSLEKSPKKKDKKREKKADKDKREEKVETESDKEKDLETEELRKEKLENKLLHRASINVRNGLALTEDQEKALLDTTLEKWQDLRAIYKMVVKKESLSEEETAIMRSSPLVLIQPMRSGEELMHFRAKIDGLPSVNELTATIRGGGSLTPEEKVKYERYRKISAERQAILRSKQRAEKLHKKDGEVADDVSPKPGTSPRPKKKPDISEMTEEELKAERERLMKRFMEEKENYIKIMDEHDRAHPPTKGQPSMRAIHRKRKKGLELTAEELERVKNERMIQHKRWRLYHCKRKLRKIYKQSGQGDAVALIDKREPEGLELAGASLGLSPNSLRLLALGSELYERNAKQRDTDVKKKKKKKKKRPEEKLDVGLGSVVDSKMTKAQRLELKKKKKRKKDKGRMMKADASLRKKNASSKLLLKAKQMKHKGKGLKMKKSAAARKLRLGDAIEDEIHSPSRMKTLLHDKLLSPTDKTIQDTVSRQMADALEADMSPDQTENSKANANQVANEVTVGSVALSRGPRIKHVCRRASVALGYSPARYEGPPPSTQDNLSLSALPVKEKKQLFTSDGEGSETDTGSEAEAYSNEASPRLTGRKRKPSAKKRAMAGFITLDDESSFTDDRYDSDFAVKTKLKKVPKVLKETTNSVSSPVPMRGMANLLMREDPSVKRRSRCGTCSACLRKFDCKTCVNCLDKPKYGGRGTKKQACIHRKCHNLVKMKMMRAKRMNEFKKIMNIPGIPHQLEKVTVAPKPKQTGPGRPSGAGRPAGARIKRAGGDLPMGLPLEPKPKKGQTGDKEEKSDAASKALRTVKFSKKIPGKHLIKTDFKEDYDMSVAWKRGMVVISSDPMIPRTICYLCGSNGKHELVYCNICCEPYHDFCLEEDERPLQDEKENWVCRNCRFCHVCDHQDKLLTCHKCRSSYHAECLGPNYPTKPSKKRKIWVCSRCVRCKSCGATTPGSDPKAQWMHGFSHCQECGKLFEKGNYCPVCKKCYEDDDFESKMMQCADCSRWVHAKCENLSDDQYRILTELPDSVPYRCPPCATHKPTPWKVEVDEELQAGFVNVLNALYACKSAGHLIWPNRRFKYMRKVQSDSKSLSTESRDSASSPAPSEASSLERETPTPDRGLEASGDGETSSAQDDVEETYSFRRGRTVRRVLRRRKQQRSAGIRDDVVGKRDGENGNKDFGPEDGEVLSTSNDHADKADENVDRTENIACDNVEDLNRTLSVNTVVASQDGKDGSDDRTLEIIDGSKVVNTDSDVIMVEGEGGPEPHGSAVQVIADSSATESSDSEDEEKVIAIDDHEDDALRTKEEQLSSIAKDNLTTSSESISRQASQENTSKDNLMPKDGANSERTTQFVSSSSADNSTGVGVFESALDILSSVAETAAQSVVEEQKQNASEYDDRTVIALEPTNNSSVANSQNADCLGDIASAADTQGDGTCPGSRTDTPTDGETSAAEEVDLDIDAKEEKIEVDNDLDSAAGSSEQDTISSVTKTNSSGATTKMLVHTPKVTFDDLLKTVLAKDKDGDTASETKTSFLSPDAIPEVDPNIPDAVMEVTTSTQSELEVCKTPAKVVTIEIGKREEEKKEEEIKPTSFQFVKAKMMAGYYKSVEKFCRDCVTIFQASFNQETDLIPGLSKSNVIAKAAFTKIMSQMFPWFNVEETRIWNGEEGYKENGVLQVAVQPPHMDHEYAQWKHKALMPSIASQPSPFKKLPTPRRRHSIIGGDGCSDDPHVALDDVSDPRRCCLCGVMGDDDPNNAGRLLYCGQDEWIHINCALWSAEVFEEVDGSLINVHAAVSRGRHLRCEVCNNLGATVGCCSRGCPANFHFMCARSRNAMFQEDKKVYCFQHADKIDKAIMGSDLFGVLRRVCVSLDNMKPNRTFSAGLEAKNINVMIGAWSLESLGHLGLLSDTEDGLFPLEFACSRVYWSTVDPCRRCIYTMRIIEVNPLTSPTTPQEVNLTTEHSPGRYPFNRKPTLQTDDDTDMLTDALMEATKESSEAAMALDQVAALLAGSQTVSEIQNAADALAATSSLFEMDEGVLDSLNLDANLNSGLDSDGIMDIMADLDNLDNLNSDGTLDEFSGTSEKFLPAADKQDSLSSMETPEMAMDDIASAPSAGAQENSNISTPLLDVSRALAVPDKSLPLPDEEQKERDDGEKTETPITTSSSEDKILDDSSKDSEEGANLGATTKTENTRAEAHDDEIPAENVELPESTVDRKENENIATASADKVPLPTDATPASNISVSADECPKVTRPDSPLISPRKVPYVKLIDIKDMPMSSSAPTDSEPSTEIAITVNEPVDVARPDSPLISPKKVPMLKLVKLPLEEHDRSYPESEDGSCDATSVSSRNTTPGPAGRDSLDSITGMSTGEKDSVDGGTDGITCSRDSLDSSGNALGLRSSPACVSDRDSVDNTANACDESSADALLPVKDIVDCTALASDILSSGLSKNDKQSPGIPAVACDMHSLDATSDDLPAEEPLVIKDESDGVADNLDARSGSASPGGKDSCTSSEYAPDVIIEGASHIKECLDASELSSASISPTANIPETENESRKSIQIPSVSIGQNENALLTEEKSSEVTSEVISHEKIDATPLKTEDNASQCIEDKITNLTSIVSVEMTDLPNEIGEIESEAIDMHGEQGEMSSPTELKRTETGSIPSIEPESTSVLSSDVANVGDMDINIPEEQATSGPEVQHIVSSKDAQTEELTDQRIGKTPSLVGVAVDQPVAMDEPSQQHSKIEDNMNDSVVTCFGVDGSKNEKESSGDDVLIHIISDPLTESASIDPGKQVDDPSISVESMTQHQVASSEVEDASEPTEVETIPADLEMQSDDASGVLVKAEDQVDGSKMEVISDPRDAAVRNDETSVDRIFRDNAEIMLTPFKQDAIEKAESVEIDGKVITRAHPDIPTNEDDLTDLAKKENSVEELQVHHELKERTSQVVDDSSIDNGQVVVDTEKTNLLQVSLEEQNESILLNFTGDLQASTSEENGADVMAPPTKSVCSTFLNQAKENVPKSAGGPVKNELPTSLELDIDVHATKETRICGSPDISKETKRLESQGEILLHSFDLPVAKDGETTTTGETDSTGNIVPEISSEGHHSESDDCCQDVENLSSDDEVEVDQLSGDLEPDVASSENIQSENVESPMGIATTGIPIEKRPEEALPVGEQSESLDNGAGDLEPDVASSDNIHKENVQSPMGIAPTDNPIEKRPEEVSPVGEQSESLDNGAGELEPDIANSGNIQPENVQSPMGIAPTDNPIEKCPEEVSRLSEQSETLDNTELTFAPSIVTYTSEDPLDAVGTTVLKANEDSPDAVIVFRLAGDAKDIQDIDPAHERAPSEREDFVPTSDAKENCLSEAPEEQGSDSRRDLEQFNFTGNMPEPTATEFGKETSVDGEIITSSGAIEAVKSMGEEETDRVDDNSSAQTNAHIEPSSPQAGDRESVSAEQDVSIMNVSAEHHHIRDKVEANEVFPRFESLTEELRMQGVGEEDMMNIVTSQQMQSPRAASEDVKEVITSKETVPRRLSSDPEHESILKALSISLSSSFRKNNNNQKSPRGREREPILSAFASDLKSRHHKYLHEQSELEDDAKKVEPVVSPTSSRNIFKKLDNPKFANAFRTFMETKQKTVTNVVDELLDNNLVHEEKKEISEVSSPEIKRRRSSRLGGASALLPDKVYNALQNGDDAHVANSFQKSDQSKRRTRHSSSDVLESDESSSKLEVLDLSRKGKKKYPMRTTSSRLQRIADEDPSEVKEPDASNEPVSEEHYEVSRQVPPDDGLISPRSSSKRKSHHVPKQDDFEDYQEEKENEALQKKQSKQRKSTDATWSPDKQTAAINHIDIDDIDGRPMRTRRLSRRSSTRMKEIIAAELEGEDSEDSEEVVVRSKGRGRPRKYPVPSSDFKPGDVKQDDFKQKGRGRPRKFPLSAPPCAEQNEDRKRVRGGSSDDPDAPPVEKPEETLPKRKRGRPSFSEQHADTDEYIDVENEGEESKKRTRAELASTSDEEQGHSRLRSRDMAKRLKPGEEATIENIAQSDIERQVHPRKQTMAERSFPGDGVKSETVGLLKKKLLETREALKEPNAVPAGEPVQREETPDTSSPSPAPESPSLKTQVRVTVKIDPLTGAISEVITGEAEEVPMDVDPGRNDPPPSQSLTMEANSSEPTSQTPWTVIDKHITGIPNLNNSSQIKGCKVFKVQSNVGNRKVIIGKDVTTNEVIYANGPTSRNGPANRNPTGGPRFRGPSTIRFPGIQPNNTRQARVRGPFSRNKQVIWQGNTACLKPGVTAKGTETLGCIKSIDTNAVVSSPNKTVVGVANVSAKPGYVTGQPISNLLPNTVPGVQTITQQQATSQTSLIATTIVTGGASSNVLSMITTTADARPVTSTAQEQYLSILQRSYQASQIQQANALAGLLPQNYALPQTFGLPQLGIQQVGVQVPQMGFASPEISPFINQPLPGVMASPTVQTLQTIIQQAGVQPSMLPGVQSPSPTPGIPNNMPSTLLDTSLSIPLTPLSPPPQSQQQPVGAQMPGFTKIPAPFHQEHMYSRQKPDIPRRRKSPHQVKVWFDSYGSLKNQDDENEEEDGEDAIPGPSPVKSPSIRMKNPSNVPRARVKNPTFGIDDLGTNKAMVKPSKKKSKPSDASSTLNPYSSLDSFSGLSSEDAFLAAMPNLGHSDHHDDSPSLLLTLMEQEKRRGPSTTPRRTSNRPHLMFEIRSDDGFETRAETAQEAWSRVVERVGELRTNTRMKHLSFDGVKGLKMFGITHEAIIFLMEQLYGAGNCHNYKFKFHKHEETPEDDEPPVNPHGAARAEVFKRTSTFDIFNFLASHHRNRPTFNEYEQQDETSDVQHKSSRRATSLQDLPMAMRFRHLKQTAKEAVGVYRSNIHGRGLFCRRPIEAGEMVIEYSGTVIRSILTDKREKYYESKGIGCYMFRIDDHDVVDATTHGNAARFINHSCEPNCFSRVIEIGGQKHIIIFASRRIARGEELTYDYKFPIEEVKIPCNCGARKCRKYLN